ncbi:TPA: type 1 fimbrial protein [Providencia alcalifaciens]|nr:type 1 fimbrial protein [Providencia alcalifaciens]
MLKRTLCIMLISVPGLVYSAEITKQIELMVKVNIFKPICKLNAGEQKINFGDFDALDVITGSSKVNGSATFKFTECSSIKNMKIKFKQVGQNPAPDTVNNYIPNANGDIMAKGVAVKLLDENKQEVKLGQIMNIAVSESQTTKDLTLNARVIPVNKTGEEISPGMLQTAIGMEISYE